MKDSESEKSDRDLFERMKDDIMCLDPVYFIEKYLTLEGKPFSLHNNGYKPLADIYRYVGLKALEPGCLPVIIVKGRQVGMTTMASALELFFMCSTFGKNGKPPIRVMHTFPQLDLAAAYSKTKLSQLISSANVDPNAPITDLKSTKPKNIIQSKLDTSASTNDSLHFKQFLNGNHLWVESIGLTGDRVIGRSCDVMFIDEVQKTEEYAIGNALKILTTAKYGNKGVQVFFGTPRKKGSHFHKRWQVSTQQYYYLGCESCKKHFPLYTPESDDWEKIWLYGYIVKCTHCGFEQDKRPAAERGKWVAYKNELDEDVKMIGFHINQLYMPFFTKEDILNEKPGVHPVNSERVFQNEVMGEFYQGDSSPITQEEIAEKCGDIGRKCSRGVTPASNEVVVIGIDYGQRRDLENMADPERKASQGQSYSTAVVMLSKGPGLLSIEFATKFKRNDVESKKSLIEELMRKYGATLVVGDIGYSNDFSEIMHKAYGDRYIVSRATGKVNGHVKFNVDLYPPEIQFDRNYYIGELFEQMKKGMIRFPYGDFDKIGWLVDHCASMDIKPSLSRNGDPVINYVKGGTPNDGFMALLNGYLAYKFLVTSKFNNIGNIQDIELRSVPRVHGMYMPGSRL